ncbi:GntR family transcriptional regulator [Clostridium sp. CF012]|uniref:GntR family transcriptional regulator n=1 Tax=Clostridium sp. CF012 TaxID=2843319 RepID=UPI001C0C0D09|nr:GntR family transcriptional regulator [Clostridium sp. CF012]MBU3144842.1 GntR family transcriptional regulator [Clostridium sp. CF012]
MKNRKITSVSNEKIPSYVAIYNMLYSDIINGLYKNGTQLPSETALSERYEVSRNTLRQALTILNEDGVISKHQGKGTFVTYKGEDEETEEVSNSNLENPIIQCCKEEIDEIRVSYNYGPPTDIAQQKLNISASEIVMASNNVYLVDKIPVAHSFIQIPVKYINNSNVNLNSEEEVSNLINKTIFELATYAKIHVKIVHAEENTTSFLEIHDNETIIYIEEILYNEQREGMARCKFYFIPDKYDLSFKV